MPLLILLLSMLLLNAPLVMEAVRASCRLFVFSVMPGLFPYLVVTLMLTSRLGQQTAGWQLMLLGWGGGSPTGARLLHQAQGLKLPVQRRLAVTCATMSPMFLLGTVPGWLSGGPAAGACLLTAVLLGGWIAGRLANVGSAAPAQAALSADAPTPLTLGQAVESAAQTMLLVCGMMALLRAAAALCTQYLAGMPMVCLAIQTLLEVTCGVEQLAALPLPLCWRMALIAGATGFGGAALLLQNRAVLPPGVLTLRRQCLMQVVHGAASFLIALGMGVMMGV